jgi:hypothetical protein
MIRFYFAFALGAFLLSTGAPAGLAYQVENVESGGSIHGRVTLKGPVPGPRAFPIVLYAFGEYCKKISDGTGHVLLREFNVDPSGGLQDAVVAVQGVEKGKPFSHFNNQFVAINCMFHPYDVPEEEQFARRDGKMTHVHPLVAIMRNHRPVYVQNKDPVLHNGQVYQPEKGNRILNFSLPISMDMHGGDLHLEKGKKIAQMICGMHEYMQTWAWIVDNPYFAKTRTGGNFTIDRLPPGTYRVTAWHPHMKPIEKVVTIPPNGDVSLDFEFESVQVVRPIYETQEEFRIGPGYHPHEHLLGCEEPYCVQR